MGGLWVDYNLMSNVPGLFVLGEANFSDHGANRLGASALMQGLADGYFVLPVHDRQLPRARRSSTKVDDRPPGVQARPRRDVAARTQAPARRSTGKRTVDSFHRELGKLMWEHCGMARTRQGLQEALEQIPELREEFWKNVRVPGAGDELNQSLEKAGRVADFLELGELMCLDALDARGVVRRPLPRGVPDRRTARRSATTRTSRTSAAWEYTGDGQDARRCTRSRSSSRTCTLAQRSYK